MLNSAAQKTEASTFEPKLKDEEVNSEGHRGVNNGKVKGDWLMQWKHEGGPVEKYKMESGGVNQLTVHKPYVLNSAAQNLTIRNEVNGGRLE